MPKKYLARFIISVVSSSAILALILIVFNLILHWPTSLFTLIIMVGVAWFLAAGLAGKICERKWSVAVPTLLAIGLIISTVGFGIPWKLKPDANQGSEEMVTFKMEASFTYLGSENNLPIENVAIRFPCPNIENSPLPTQTFWSLYYLDEDNVLVLEADQNQVYGFKGDRKQNLTIYLSGIEKSYDGPKIYFNFDRMYPREIFCITTVASAKKSFASKVTLRIFGDSQNRSSAHWQNTRPAEIRISLVFKAQLLMENNGQYHLVENFSRVAENILPTGLWLYQQL
jgi:hypothetical protein